MQLNNNCFCRSGRCLQLKNHYVLWSRHSGIQGVLEVLSMPHVEFEGALQREHGTTLSKAWRTLTGLSFFSSTLGPLQRQALFGELLLSVLQNNLAGSSTSPALAPLSHKRAADNATQQSVREKESRARTSQLCSKSDENNER